MGEVAFSLKTESVKGMEIVVHVDETLSDERRSELSEELTKIKGIHAADFCPLRFHLMVLGYDRERMTSQDVLTKITSTGVHAKLIGPV